MSREEDGMLNAVVSLERNVYRPSTYVAWFSNDP